MIEQNTARFPAEREQEKAETQFEHLLYVNGIIKL